jgi:hypothetical protein
MADSVECKHTLTLAGRRCQFRASAALSRAAIQYPERHPHADFVRQSGASEARSLQTMVDTFLVWRDEIDHLDPEQAIRFAFLIVATVLRDLVLLDRMRLMAPVIPVDDDLLERELPKVFLRCLGVTVPRPDQEEQRPARLSARRPGSYFRLRTSCLLDGLRRFVRGNPQRTEEASIVGGHFERAFRLHNARGRRDFGQGGRLRAADESHHCFQRDFHLETRGPRLLAARFYLRILCDRGGDRVGQLSCEPVHDVVHLLPPYAAGPVSGAFPNRGLHQEWWTGTGRLTCVIVVGKTCRLAQFMPQR